MTPFPGIETQRARVQSRVRRFLWVAAGYGAALILIFAAFAAKLLGAWGIVTLTLAIVAVNATFFALLSSGRSEDFRDAEMVWPQTIGAIAIFSLAFYHFDYDRGVVLLACFSILVIGLFRFGLRDYLTASILVFSGVIAAQVALFLFKPWSVDLQRQAFHLLVLVLSLPGFAYFCARLTDLNRRRQPAYDELTTAVATIEQLAAHDRLTSLANRATFVETLSGALARAEKEGREIAVVSSS